MACRSCRKPLDLLPLRPLSVSHAAPRNPPRATRRALHATAAPRLQQQPQPQPASETTTTTTTTSSSRLQKWLIRPVADRLRTTARKTTHSYMVYGATEHIYKTCAAQADYKITQADRKAGKVQLLPDGEEVGVGSGMWHDDFKLLPTFSTWSQVTMLHMYLLVVRLRCLDRDAYQTWQSQLVDHFFHDAEAKMEVAHELTSRAMRQRYLKDLFVQWRGLLLAYDEGLVRGDAVLASALWRNLFKGREDVDVRVLAAVVSWMRLSLRNLDQMKDEAIVTNAVSAFKWPAKSELALVDRPVKALDGVYGGARKETASSPT